jgi:hypothetical protein
VFDDAATHLANVDLEVQSREPLDAFVAALEKKVSVHFVGSIGRGRYGAFLSRASYGRSADRLTRELCTLVSRLPRRARSLWARARAREFNVGICARLEPCAHEIRLAQRTIGEIAKLGGTIVITTYAPERKAIER